MSRSGTKDGGRTTDLQRHSVILAVLIWMRLVWLVWLVLIAVGMAIVVVSADADAGATIDGPSATTQSATSWAIASTHHHYSSWPTLWRPTPSTHSPGRSHARRSVPPDLQTVLPTPLTPLSRFCLLPLLPLLPLLLSFYCLAASNLSHQYRQSRLRFLEIPSLNAACRARALHNRRRLLCLNCA